MPGGVTYVSRGFARIVPSARTTPTEILFALPSNPIASVVDDVVGAVGAARVDAASGIATTRGRVRRASIHSCIRRSLDALRRLARRASPIAAESRRRDDARTGIVATARSRDGDRATAVDGAIARRDRRSRDGDRKVVRDDDARDDDDVDDARATDDDGGFGGRGGRGGRGGGRDDDAVDEVEDGDDDDATRGARRAAFALAAATATGAGGAREANATTTTTRRRGDGGRRATKLGDMATSALYGFAAFYGIKIALKRLFAPFALFWGTTQLLFRMHAVKISPAMLHERLIRPYLPIEYQKSLNDFGVAAMKTKAAKNAMRDGWWDKQERRFWTCAHRLLPACDSAMGERAFVFGVILAGLA